MLINCINECFVVAVVVVVVLLPKGTADVTLKINGNNKGPRQLLDGRQKERTSVVLGCPFLHNRFLRGLAQKKRRDTCVRINHL